MTEFRVLVLTPDFPPMAGGIQHLVRRLGENVERARMRFVAPAAHGADAIDRELPFEVRRVGTHAQRQASLAAVNAVALREAIRFRPHVVLAGHLIVSPGARVAARAVRAPIVQYFYANEIGARPVLARKACEAATASIAISTFTRELLLGLGVDAGRVHLITPGVDLPPEPARNGVDPAFVTVARMEERYKGHDVLARALPVVRSKVPEARWLVIGSGRLRGTFEALVAANCSADAATFTGPVADEERDRLVRESAVFAMPSRLPAGRPGGEGFGIVFLEAGAQGLPVVAGNVGGAVDAVRDGETGLLVDPTDHLAVADALVELLTDRERAKAMGRAGRKLAEEHAWPIVARRVEDLLFAVAGR